MGEEEEEGNNNHHHHKDENILNDMLRVDDDDDDDSCFGCDLCQRPYPIMNFITTDDDDTQKCRLIPHSNTTNESLKEACHTHGAFYVRIHNTTTTTKDNHNHTNNNNDYYWNTRIDLPRNHDEVAILFPSSLSLSTKDTPWKAHTDSPNNNDNDNNNKKIDICSRRSLYRGMSCESGSNSTTEAEPKESWEYTFCSTSHGSNSNEPNKNTFHKEEGNLDWTLHKWASSLHQVVIAIMKLLNWDDQLIYYYNNNNNKDSQQQHPSSLNHCQRKDVMDLMRVFYYHPQQPWEEANSSSSLLLGSSPHTDWGTWTVVWQDDVGGLELQCPQCQSYRPISPIPSSSTKHHTLFVHVGDMTSLASGRTWTSPIHLVKRSMTKHRTSLVYFAYPPKSITFPQFQKLSFPLTNDTTTHNEEQQQQRRRTLPYSHYRLLHNQQQQQQTTFHETNNSITDSELAFQMEFQKMQNIPIHQVIENKWKQVQR